MEITTETVAPREVEFTIRPEPERVEEARRQAARAFSKRVRIPGFRPGKAPYALIERTVGRNVLNEEAAEILAPDLYKQALEQGNYEPFGQPTLRIVQQEPLEVKIRVPLRPVVELGDYCALEIAPEPPAQVTPEQEEKLLNELREQYGTWVPVERPAQLGDQVTVDIKGVSEGKTVSDESGAQFVVAESLSPDGLVQALVGLQPGETREFEWTYPIDAHQEELAGKKVTFTVTLRELKERKLPQLDDEFARSVGDYASLDDLKAHLRAGLQARLEAEARQRLEVKVLDQVVERSKVEYPNAALEREIDRLIQERESRLRRQGFTLASYLRATHKSEVQLRDELRAEAEENLRRSLVLYEVGRVEGIDVSTEELTAEVDRMSEAYGEQAAAVRQMLLQEAPLASLREDIYARKALERLVDVATGKVESACKASEAPSVPSEKPSEPSTGAESPAGT